jgi:predicted transcriptional regulator of viral defense system
MPIIKYKNILQQVMEKPVFGVDDLAHRDIQRSYAKKLLHESFKSGRITRVERGKYTILDDPLIVATHLTEPCYVSLWSALSIHHLTTQIPFAVEVITPRKRFNRKIMFQNTPIVFYTVQPGMMYGYENIIWKEDRRIPVAKPEKIIVDAIYFHAVALEELLPVVASLDIKLLRSYAQLAHDSFVITTVERLLAC